MYWAAILLFGLGGPVFGQGFQVRGKVSQKSTAEALAGASVTVKGSTTAVVTNTQGEFQITVPEKQSTLVVSYSGMKKVEYRLSDPS